MSMPSHQQQQPIGLHFRNTTVQPPVQQQQQPSRLQLPQQLHSASPNAQMVAMQHLQLMGAQAGVNSVFVSNFHARMTEQKLAEMFEQVGEPVQAVFIARRRNGNSKCWGLVLFSVGLCMHLVV